MPGCHRAWLIAAAAAVYGAATTPHSTPSIDEAGLTIIYTMDVATSLATCG